KATRAGTTGRAPRRGTPRIAVPAGAGLARVRRAHRVGAAGRPVRSPARRPVGGPVRTGLAGIPAVGPVGIPAGRAARPTVGPARRASGPVVGPAPRRAAVAPAVGGAAGGTGGGTRAGVVRLPRVLEAAHLDEHDLRAAGGRLPPAARHAILHREALDRRAAVASRVALADDLHRVDHRDLL